MLWGNVGRNIIAQVVWGRRRSDSIRGEEEEEKRRKNCSLCAKFSENLVRELAL